jgi:anaerobic ribonucleoside-triphosphate reductase activating protein
MSTLRLNQIVFGLKRGVLGMSSNRMGVWTQGCSLNKCPGCASVHTWSPESGKSVPVERLLSLALGQARSPTGLTVSGGEPTDQPDGVVALAKGFRSAFPGTEVILYTGLRWSVLEERHPSLVEQLDVAVTGPYVRTLGSLPLAGSSNQEVHLLTDLAKSLYQDWQQLPTHTLQVGSAREGTVVTVGIPHTPRMEFAAESVGAVGTWQAPNGVRVP